MEHLNKIELVGTVGYVNNTKVGDLTNIRFSVATNYAYKSNDGCAVIETTWHNCTAWSDKNPKATQLTKGDTVHLSGRLRIQKYEGADGVGRTFTEIVVNNLDIVG